MTPRRKYDLICFDLDGTLIDNTRSVWDTLHTSLFTDLASREKAREDALRGRISYAEWFYHDLKLLKEVGATQQDMERALLQSNVRPIEGVPETLLTLKSEGYTLAVISGGLRILFDMIFPEHPFSHVWMNEFHFSTNGHLIGGSPTPYDMEGKAQGLLDIAKEERIKPSRTVFVGDNTNDIHALLRAGLGIAFNADKKTVRDAADVVIQKKDMRAIIPYLK